MTRLDAQRKLREVGQSGNFRFQGLLLAGLGEVSFNDMAKAWPTKPSDYRFLQANKRYDVEAEANNKVAVAEDSDEFHLLSDYAEDALEETKHEGLYQTHPDTAIQHMLFAASTPEEVDTLFRNQLADTIVEGAQRRQAARQGAFIFNADTNEGTITVADDRQYSYDGQADVGLGEGAAIPDDREGYSTVSWNCNKLGVGARVTDEMIRHARVDLIERQIEHVGVTIENDINRIWVNELVDNAGATDHQETAGVSALNGAITNVEDNDFMADTFVTFQGYREQLFDDTNLVYVNRAGQDNPLTDREVPAPLMGLEHLAMTASAYDAGNETIGWTNTGDVGAVAYQQDALWLVIEQDIEVKDYEDPIRDLEGVNARAWVDAVYGQANAAGRVEHA